MQTRAELETENAQIRAQLQQNESQYRITIKSKDHLIEILKEALILEAHRKFAKASESLRSLQSELFNEAEFDLVLEPEIEDTGDAPIEVPAHTRQRGGRKALPAELPRIEVIYDLSDDEKVCDQGHALKQISEKTSEQLDIIPMKVQVIRHIRKQYACPCCEGVLKLASKPKQPIEKSQASSGLLAYIAVSKYADSLPLYRQNAILSRSGIDINRSTLANWMTKCGELIQPLINCFEEQVLSQSFIHMDETPVQVLNEKGKPAESKSYMWVRHAGPPGQRITLFDYDPSRSGAVPRRLLAGYAGALMLDGYEGYAPVCKEQGLTRLGCWVHARRKFVDVSKASKKRNSQATYAIKLIAKLYAIEKTSKDSSAEDRYQIRIENAKPVIDKLRQWLDETKPKVPPKSLLGKALQYLDNQWPRLIAYLEDGQYPIDNNRVENAIRPFAIGRKNWLFSASVNGAKASANLYSLIETAKANDLEPYAYLKRVFTELPNAQSYDDVEKLLPSRVKDVAA